MSQSAAAALRERVRAGAEALAADALRLAPPEAAAAAVQAAMAGWQAEAQPSNALPLACAPGCAACCHLRIQASPAEVFVLLDHLRLALDEAAFAAFAARVREAAARVQALGREAHLRTNLACPVLVDGRCVGHAARPLVCRGYHSVDRAACDASFARPGDLGLPIPQKAGLKAVAGGVLAGVADALGAAGIDREEVELATALAEALDDGEAVRARLRAGRPAFGRAQRG